jgi:N12 class adenine-specific DNA methylase
MLATIIFHLFINIFQEKIAMTPETKIIETGVFCVASAIIVILNKGMFFDRKHIRRLLEMQYEEDDRSEDKLQKVSPAVER